jgi:phosphatidate phosphatase APP1
MTQPGTYGGGGGGGYEGSGYNSLGGDAPQGRERGSRRRKLAGYLKAANELRQSYQQSSPWANRGVENDDEKLTIPGAFPDVAIVSHGDEQLVLFPSYCKRHVKEKRHAGPGSLQLDQNGSGNVTRDAEFWKKEWEKFEDDKAIVDVDVHGWLYSPHKGPMSRRNRVLIGLARQLSGIPAPRNDASKSRESSPDPLSLRVRHEAYEALREQERIAKEAEEILKKGQGEEDIAARGGYSENPSFDSDDDESVYNSRGRRGRGESPGSDASPQSELPGPGFLSKRQSWNQPSNMSPEKLATANSHLMARLMPFLTNPVVSTPITIFFYNNKTSQSKTVVTNEAGHFNIRAALDFVPTHVRALASEYLSATEEVKITEPKGVSLISDVDDTIKHSSIGSGARDIFRNAFIRDLADLTIDGVKEWYNTMYDMGVSIHYVSNSPWQLFPVLVSFFQVAGLPPGSYHLKQYSGMLQGIFEPVAERKKGTLERIMRDFPERRFLLVGDSGEADLEVYTDVALANPGKIIGIFIRDVTTPRDQGFFDSAMGPLSGDRRTRSKKPSRGFSGDSIASRFSSMSDTPESRPPLPKRILTETTPQTSDGPTMGKLIDFDDEPEEINVHESHRTVLPRSISDLEVLDSPRRRSAPEDMPSKVPPVRPMKPLSLRSATTDNGRIKPLTAKVPPPPPPRKSTNRSLSGSEDTASQHPLSQTQNTSELPSSKENQGYLVSAREKVSNVYNSIPPASSYLPSRTSNPSHSPSSGTESSLRPSDANQDRDRDTDRPPLPRRGVAATAAAYASNRLSWGTRSAETSDDEGSSANPASYEVPVNKKVDMWRRRWKRAKDILDAHHVELRSWRTGEDVRLDACRLVERHMREMGVEGYGDSAKSKGGKGKTGEGGGEVKAKDVKK